VKQNPICLEGKGFLVISKGGNRQSWAGMTLYSCIVFYYDEEAVHRLSVFGLGDIGFLSIGR